MLKLNMITSILSLAALLAVIVFQLMEMKNGGI